MSDTKHCIYCTKNKPVAEFSKEHIIPQFMGGSSDIAEIVTTDVCRQCNSLFGRYVDAAVAKGYFLNSIEHGSWKSCFDYDHGNGNVYPLTYLGRSTEIRFGDNEEVEVWLAPDGGTAWHIHTKGDDDFDAFASGDPVLRRRDANSRVYSFIASEQMYWVLSNLKSVKKHFYCEPIFSGTDLDLENLFSVTRRRGAFCQKDGPATAERDQIRKLLDERRQLGHSLQMDTLFDARFLAKLSIAFGYNLFGADFGALNHTESMRKLLWTRRKNLNQAENNVRMKTYFADLQDRSLEAISLQFGFVFLLKVIGRSTIISIIFPSGHSIQSTIIDETVDFDFDILRKWKGDHVFVSIPQLERTIGPIAFPEYLSWRLGNIQIESLDKVSARITLRDQMPPLRGGSNPPSLER